MWRVVLTIFSLFWIGVQLTYLEAVSAYAWVFLIGDAILGLSLFIIAWFQEIENIEKRDNKNEKDKF
ncbi:hypothetical protein LI033_00805 [bacterium TM223]|uniref:hypothetical protein n=1 Tax=Faecalibacillus intestinalis TaxID=1982626 RepID=UPI0021091E6F|nr:hypothetical protein [Faecalibacillus intestinalis]MCB7553064.1 hypothetical protein [bacterium TM223]MCQ4766049.1 hypothetical protein [Faecalibacillus intestinalis]